MNMFKKNGGFTLVELIVVIAILAILAAVAVPAYTGYIAKAEEAGDLQMLSAVNTAVQGLAAAEGEIVEHIKVTVVPNADEEADAEYKLEVLVTKTETVYAADGVTPETNEDGSVKTTSEIVQSEKVTVAEVEDLVPNIEFGDKFVGAFWFAGDWTLGAECSNHVNHDTEVSTEAHTCDVCGYKMTEHAYGADNKCTICGEAKPAA